MSVARDDLHKLVDSLPECETETAFRLLRRLMERGREVGQPRRRRQKKRSGEGMLRLFGIAEGPPDLAQRHDAYLAQALEEEFRR